MAKAKFIEPVEPIGSPVPRDEGMGRSRAEDAPPPFAVVKTADTDGPLPRVVHPLERAPAGLVRFKVACLNYSPQPSKYILAKTEADAVGHYRTVTKLDVLMAKLQGKRAEPVDDPAIVCVALAD